MPGHPFQCLTEIVGERNLLRFIEAIGEYMDGLEIDPDS